MTATTDLWKLSASQIANLVQLRKVSATEVTQSALGRLNATNPALNAVVECRPDEVLTRARQVDEAIARGSAVGPLAGVPVGIKVNIDQAGYANTNGLKSQKNLVANSNSPVVDSLLAAGAVPLGRTNTPAFSYRWFTGNQLHGATRNPHDATLTPGGSSGGSAAAVAAGMCPLAHGTDIAGSIRYPAYACGVHGLRPTLGRVAAYNASAAQERNIGGQIMAVSGPIARTPSTTFAWGCWRCRGPMPATPGGSRRRLRGRTCRAASPCACVRTAWTRSPRSAPRCWTPPRACATPAGSWTSSTRCRLKDGVAIQVTLWMGDGYEAQVQAAEREGDPGAIAALAGQAELARSIGIPEFSAALSRRLALARAWHLFMERYPVVMLPVSAELPFPNDLDLQGPEAYQRVWRAQMPMIAVPVTGLPALTVTTGMVDRSPVGVQLVAGRFREDMCLAAGAAIEARGAGGPAARLRV